MFSRILAEDVLNPLSVVPGGRLIDPSGPRRTLLEQIRAEPRAFRPQPSRCKVCDRAKSRAYYERVGRERYRARKLAG